MGNNVRDESLESIRTAIQFGGEAMVPGGSNLVKGDLKTAVIYAAAGFAARVALGLPGLLLVSASSFTKAVSGRHLHEHLGYKMPKLKLCTHDDDAPASSPTSTN